MNMTAANTNTILKEASVTSKSLMTGVDCTARLVPSDKKGIRFHLGDKEITAHVDNVVSTEHCTVIGNQDIKVMLIEHFMAACAICHIEAIDVYLSHSELPILGGGSKEWVEIFKEAENTANERYTIKEPFAYINGKTHLIVLPSDELKITYSVNFNHPELNHRWVCLDKEKIDEIVEARTFGYLKELEMLQAAGYARGVSIENTVGLTEDGYTTELKSEFEPAKHKILDLIGDFYLTGFNPLDWKAEIIVKEAGHTVHVKAAKTLKDLIYVKKEI